MSADETESCMPFQCKCHQLKNPFYIISVRAERRSTPQVLEILKSKKKYAFQHMCFFIKSGLKTSTKLDDA
ncbi:hypothetical protein HYN56_19880 [Flavobacterium crocinum]|uniref:Uncharacterized protein n=1 Tax=Flavobacterium crocinum TaxID=2183896 RepID=A0A2S1YQT1_9FLAO|nr:hypothetical protein HYN56_19880 [Flavobacterium crocinum]